MFDWDSANERDVNMHWREEPAVSKGVSERPFYVVRGDEQIPGILWEPAETRDMNR